ncbi:MAG: fumarylacetoacetate hydrolase family protein [Lautropia sp.]
MYALTTILADRKPTPAVTAGGRYWPLSDLAPDLLAPDDGLGLMALMKDWARVDAALAERLPARLESVPALLRPPGLDEILAPLLYPGKVCCTGANYRQHMTEVGLSKTFDKAAVRPSFFMKPPRTAVVGSGRSVRYPVQSSQFDWEIELAVVIGKTARHVAPSAALQYVAGYMVGIDLSARDYLLHKGNMAGFDTFGGKGFDDSCPLGPALVPARFVPDPQNLELTLRLNGQVKQHGNTSQMVWTVAEQIAEMSAIMTLEPGDVLLTGTPAGSGLSEGRFLQPGDRIQASIDRLGCLDFEIVPSPYAGQPLPCALR